MPPTDESAAPPDASQLAPSTVEVLDSIFFAQNGSTLQEATIQLEAVASSAMRSDSRGVLLIIGHAEPTEASPRALSLQRAIAVQNFLVGRGVPRQRIQIKALGASPPDAGATAPPGGNQRVEIHCVACVDR